VKRQWALDSLHRLPPFSAILSKLMASLSGQDVSFAVLGDLIEKDAVVAGNILRVVNSAVYARRGTVNSVRHALSVLGVEKVRNTVLAMSISRMLHQAKTPQSWSMERFNKHSAGVAMLSDLIAQQVRGIEYPEGAFVSGLLHDVGRLLIAMGLPQEHTAIVKLHLETGRAWADCEEEVLGFGHAGLSADVMAQWKIPDPIRDAILSHHSPPPTREVTLARVLNAADAFVNASGNTIQAGPPGDPNDLSMFAELGLDDARQQKLVENFQAEYNAIAQYYH
jgi:HD-like signal output (HDOD) protein